MGVGFLFGVIILNLDGGDDVKLCDHSKEHRTVYLER